MTRQELYARRQRKKKAAGRKKIIMAGISLLLILAVVLVVNFFTAIVLAVAIAITSAYFGNSSVWLALATGVVVWLAFSATTLLTHNMFEQKPLKLTAINSGYQLAMFVVMSLAIGLWHGL